MDWAWYKTKIRGASRKGCPWQEVPQRQRCGVRTVMVCWERESRPGGCHQGSEEEDGQGAEGERPGSQKGSTLKYADCRRSQHFGPEVINWDFMHLYVGVMGLKML